MSWNLQQDGALPGAHVLYPKNAIVSKLTAMQVRVEGEAIFSWTVTRLVYAGAVHLATRRRSAWTVYKLPVVFVREPAFFSVVPE